MKRALEPVAWWVGIFAGYLGLIYTVSVSELVAAAVTATAASLAAVGARRVLFTRRGRRGSPILVSPLVPAAQVVHDVVRLAGRLRGGFAERRIPPDRRTAGRTGALTLLLSVTPGTYVAQVAPGRDRLVVHRIGPRPDRLERRLLE